MSDGKRRCNPIRPCVKSGHTNVGVVVGCSNMSANYNRLRNKPSINGLILEGNLTSEDLGLTGAFYNTTEAWDSMGDLVGEKGRIYIYSDHRVITDPEGNLVYIPGIRIGDGLAYLRDLPFVSGDSSEEMSAHIYNGLIHVSMEDRIRWDEKVTAYLADNDFENLVLAN